jgi:hypothetical protein
VKHVAVELPKDVTAGEAFRRRAIA